MYLIFYYCGLTKVLYMQEILLGELGLAHNKEDKEWPLYVSPTALTLFGRLALTEQEECLRKRQDSGDTPRAINAWRLLLERLEKGTEESKEDTEKGAFLSIINLDILQLICR